jgi:hypothetical protein
MGRSPGRDLSTGHSVLGMTRINVIVVPMPNYQTIWTSACRVVQGEGTDRCERLWQVREMDEDAGVLELQERQIRNVQLEGNSRHGSESSCMH